MADLLVEVDEAMKQERLEKLWRQYGGFFIGFLLILILGTAANAGYKSWSSAKNAAQTALYLDVVDQPDYNAQDLLDLAPSLHGGFRDVVTLRSAGLFLEQEDLEKARVTYDSLSQYAKSRPVAQISSYMAAVLTDHAEEKLAALQAVTSGENSPWRYRAALDSALLQADVVKDYTKAREHLSVILEADIVPPTLKQKAQSLDLLYALKEKI